MTRTTRRPDPPLKAQAARARLESRGVSPRQQIEAALAKMAELGRLAASMVASVPPPTVPKPPPPPPQRKLTWDDRCGWHIPSNLSQAELASTEPSEHRTRALRWHAARLTRPQNRSDAARDQLRARMPA